MEELYADPKLYSAVLGPATEEEVEFWLRVLADGLPVRRPALPVRRRVLSLGCGCARVERHLSRAGHEVTGIDLSEEMIEAAQVADSSGKYLVGNVRDLAGAVSGPFDVIISGLLSFAYVVDEQEARGVLASCAERLAGGGIVALEVPLAWEPSRLQGVEERFGEGDVEFRFQWLDEIRRGPYFSVLDSRMEMRASGREAVRMAPLAVYEPEGIVKLFRDAMGEREGKVRFYAPYEMESGCQEPPKDCLRGIVVCERVVGLV